jgi:hypothetical protein
MITSSGPYFTQFDYGDGDVTFKVLPASRFRELIGDAADSHFSRMAQSEGKMQLDVVIGMQGVVTDGKITPVSYPWLFPMRSNSSKLHDGLINLVSRVWTGKMSQGELDREIRELARESSVLELH